MKKLLEVIVEKYEEVTFPEVSQLLQLLLKEATFSFCVPVYVHCTSHPT